jgi:hypothetical protein
VLYVSFASGPILRHFGSSDEGMTMPFGAESRMNGPMARDIEAWEDDGGAAPASLARVAGSLDGTPAQVEWAQRIKRHVAAEFDRVAASFRFVASRQSDDKRADTEAVLEILEDKRVEVMKRDQAGYFIHDWQEIRGQVLQLIIDDPRYEAIKRRTTARRANAQLAHSSTS